MWRNDVFVVRTPAPILFLPTETFILLAVYPTGQNHK